jgi:hypothetical protein
MAPQKRVCREQLVFAGVLMLLSLAALSAWYVMPVYPDEIAFRQQLGRYIQDGGVVHGLYPLCVSNIKETPFLFVIPAWILSWMDLAISPIEMRIFPFATVFAAVNLAIWYAIRGINPNAAVMATTAFIGVAGSGLILARYEYVQALSLVCCLGAVHFLTSVSQRPILRYGLFVLLLTSILLSVYAHVQGILFLPLALYLAYHLIRPGLGKFRAAFMMVALLLLMAQTTITFHHSTCVGYPEIEQFWKRMTFNLDELEPVKPIHWLQAKFGKYLGSFEYKKSYVINYLPGIVDDDGWQQKSRGVLNHVIRVILLVNLLLSIFVAIGAHLFTMWRCVTQRQSRVTGGSTWLGHGQSLALLLLVVPVIFLFLYDSAQNFYRSFFLNFLSAILLTLLLSRLPLARVRTVTTLYFGLCGVVVIASLVANVWWFTGRLSAGYEGPSISVNRDWHAIGLDLKALAADCDMELSKGRIIVDDMTYDTLKNYPLIYPVTYMALSAEIVKSTMADVLNKVRPNYAIARCDSLRGGSIGYQKSRNQLCCANFIRAAPPQ